MFKPKNKILIFSIILAFGVTFSYCGKKKSGLLLLPDLVQGQGGPQVSPDNPKTSSEESSTTQQTPAIEVTDDTGTTDTANSNNQGSDNNNQGNGNNGGVVFLGPPQQDQGNNSNNQNSGNDNNNANNNQNSGNQNQQPPASDDNSNANNKPPINQEPPQSDDKSDDVAQDPVEEVVVNDNPPINQEPPQSEEDVTKEEQQEEDNATQEEQKEEVSDEDNSDTTNSDDNSEAEDVNNQKCKAKLTKIDTSQGRWFNTNEELLPHPKKPGKSIKAKGIHTYWAYQKLLVNVNSNCEGGKYRLIVVAKNIHGPLPDWYHFFNVKVVNETTGENLGTMLIRASDKHYYRGKLDIKLAKGENTINILWTNDAYEQNKFDANIQIKRIFVKKIVAKQAKQILTRIGSNFCDSNGRWFIGVNPPSAYTYWQGQTVSYCLRTKQAGKYEILIRAGNAKNGLPLMPEYKEFKVLVAANGNSNYITIPAEQGKYHKGTTTLDLPEGDVVLNVTWLNDKYQPDKYDANIEIRRVKIKRIGNASSPISAFLLQNPNITYKVLIPSTILVIGILGMIYWFRRKENIA